jgi:uncharacterized protein
MAYYATRRFNYWGQLGMLTAFIGAGLIIGGLASFIPLLGKVDIFGMKGDTSAIMKKLLVPENATVLRWSQLITTLFLFFLPPFLYAKVCHVKPFQHLGFGNMPTAAGGDRTFLSQLALVLLIMTASLPAVSALQDLTSMLPWSKSTMQHFKEAEEAYNQQVAVIARMDNFTDYLISTFIIALLPAVFEELLFRGAIQNLFSRWSQKPVLAVVITAIIFSAVHGSYLGFLSRFALGFVLGWLFYRTGNIWLNIAGHFFNNAAGVTMLYLTTKAGEKINLENAPDHFPLWAGLLSIAIVAGLFIVFEKVSKKNIDRSGEEVLIPGYNFSDNPFTNDIATKDTHLQ